MSCYSKMSEEQKKIHQARTALRGVERKERLIEMAGGKCKCGYAKCTRSMHFHHTDPATKKFELNVVNIRCMNWDDVINESKKCILLCSNCHGEEEERLSRERFFKDNKEILDGVDRFDKWSDVLRKAGRSRKVLLPEIEKTCRACSQKFKTKYDFNCCSAACRATIQRKAERPSKKELAELIDQGIPWVHLGKKFNVSDNAVRKWAKGYQLIK